MLETRGTAREGAADSEVVCGSSMIGRVGAEGGRVWAVGREMMGSGVGVELLKAMLLDTCTMRGCCCACC